jgi:hypothetical protein
VATRLRQVTPEKLEQYELLLQDQRSVRRLADATLNDETVITTENAERLLELMRQATVEEERKRFEEQQTALEDRHKAAQRLARARAQEEIARREAALEAAAGQIEQHEQTAAALRAEVEKHERRQAEALERVVAFVNWRTLLADRLITGLLLLLGGVAVLDYFGGFISQFGPWRMVLALAGFIGMYQLICELLRKPTLGIGNLLNVFGRALLRRELEDVTSLGLRFSTSRCSRGEFASVPALCEADHGAPAQHRRVYRGGAWKCDMKYVTS